MTNLLAAADIEYSYRLASGKYPALRGVNLAIRRGEMVAICGPSGSGKSSLLYVLGCLIRPDRGDLFFDGVDLGKLNEDERALFRAKSIGFVFQHFHLQPKLTVAENIALPAMYPIEVGEPPDVKDRVNQLAQLLGLDGVTHHLPNQLSGGQQQRVAIARALLRDPPLVLADEPTGNLDSQNSQRVMETLRGIQRSGKSVVIITHEREIADQCDRVITIRDGKVVDDDPSSVNSQSTGVTRRWPRPADWHAGALRNLIQLLPLAAQSVFANRVRSLLTMLGIVIGIASVLALLTLGGFVQNRILETYEALGVNKLSISGYRNWRQRATDTRGVPFRSFDVAGDFDPLYRLFPAVAMIAPEVNNWGVEASFGGQQMKEVNIIGSSPEWFAINNRQLAEGALFTPHHVKSNQPVCVIGSDLRNRLFAGRTPIGETLYLSDSQRVFHCQVIGSLKPIKVNDANMPVNAIVVTPYTFLQSVSMIWHRNIERASMQLKSGTEVASLAEQIRSFFVHRYGSSGEFRVDSDDILVAQMKRFLGVFRVLLGGVGIISLVVGGIGIANMMLVSVNERYREIGLRKALGATPRSIRYQLLLEAVVICAVAGVVGLVCGVAAYQGSIFAATKLVDNLAFEWVFDASAFALSTICIIAVGILSGIVPAVRAERLEVIEAMRAE